MSATGPGGVRITIDELVLHGVPPERADVVMASLQQRLAELATDWTARPTELAGRNESSRRLPPVEVPAGSAAALGASVADAVWSAVGGALQQGGRPR